VHLSKERSRKSNPEVILDGVVQRTEVQRAHVDVGDAFRGERALKLV